MENIWKTWNELKDIAKEKKIFLFGRSEDWIHKTIKNLKEFNNIEIIDNNLAYENTVFFGLKVVSSKILESQNKEKIYIIITSGAYESVSAELIEKNFKPGINFCCSPAFKDWGLLQKIRSYKKELIISSPDYKERSRKRHSKHGGGLYLCDTSTNEIEQKVPGQFRQIIEVDNLLYVVEFVEKKIYVVDKKFKVLDKFDTDQSAEKKAKPNACGITYCNKRKLFFVSNTGSDEIHIYEKENFKFIDKIKFSNKFDKSGDGQHHINDLCMVEENLIVCYFSFSGGWKRGIMDGGIAEIDLDNLKAAPKPLFSDFWMPHSVKYIDGEICLLDSMRGSFWIGNKRIEGSFPGFIRGLTYDNRFYYIGQSEGMYMIRLFGLSNNIMCNAGVYLFDIEQKISRFFSFPDIMNVHDIYVLR